MTSSSMVLPVTLTFTVAMMSWMSCVQCADLNLFYPFGANVDMRLKKGDEGSSDEIKLWEGFRLFNRTFRSIYVNVNGHVSFDSEFPSYRVDMALPLGYHLVAPFYADVDTTATGNVFYRNTTDPRAIQRAAADIQTYFSKFQAFMPSHLFIATWDKVGYFSEKDDKTNTFQVVLATDGKDTFALFHYQDNGIGWKMSDGRFTPTYPDIPPQAGFDGGESGYHFLLPGSGDTASFLTGSNVNVPGVWMYHIGSAGMEAVNGADLNTEEVTVFEPRSADGCAQAAGVCDVNAKCVEHDSGICCVCLDGFYGNGYECASIQHSIALNSRVVGSLNGIRLDADSSMHTYVITKEGRMYSAISMVAPELASQMQTLNSIGGVAGWLFAYPIHTKAKNGYTLTGGKFNRSATVTYQMADGTPDKVVRINQDFRGTEGPKNLRFESRVEGQVPDIPAGAVIKIDDYSEDYIRVRPGVVTSNVHRVYRVNGVARRYTVDQTIYFEECDDGSARYNGAPEMTRVSFGKHYVRYMEHNKVVRYGMSAKAGYPGATDPCTSFGRQCHQKAECVAQEDTYKCVCVSGYYGNGITCRDEDECRQNVCDRNARCQNTPGSFRCQCNPGYSGDGRTCSSDVPLCGGRQCDANARCVFDPSANQHACECNPGFRGDGQRCQEVVERDCRSGNVCGRNAECVYDDILREYVCECQDDFSGDGYSCEAVDPGCSACDRNAECQTDPLTFKESCRCQNGFSGDGRSCSLIDVCAKCDPRAQCVLDTRVNQYRCLCLRGFRGDGETCSRVDCRNETGMCAEEGGLCWLNPNTNFAICRCNIGYRGDGYRCEKASCDVYNDCDPNARCVAGPDGFSCQCMEGFVGSGQRCRPEKGETCDVTNFCDVNARCVPDQSSPPVFSCRCVAGYRGDGRRCEPREGETCDVNNFCDVNARCVPDQSSPPVFSCRCVAGYRGDGRRCVPREEETCDVKNFCDVNARCVPDQSSPPVYSCRCVAGYRGDGRRCEPREEETCDVNNFCDVNARCVPDQSSPPVFSCRCVAGYRGDGRRCIPEGDELTCDIANICDVNARCVPDRSATPVYSCRCVSGYEGDGMTCQPIRQVSCNQVNNCDRDAICTYNPDTSSYQCVCNRGFEGDGITCQRREVPDCRRDPRLCSTNADCARGVDNAFVCVCRPGFRGDGSSCSPVITEGDALIYAQGTKLMKVSTDAKPGDIGQQIAYLKGQLAVGVDVDCREGHIYWSDVAGGFIRRSDMKGDNMTVVLNGLKSPEGVAVDFSGRNLFFADSELDVVRVAKLDGSAVKTLVDTDMVNPRAITLDITKGTVYWTDWNRNRPQIERMNMDGSDRSVLVDQGLSLPNGLAFDAFSQLLCWGDAGEKKIECIKSDGSGRRVVHGGATYPFDIAMVNNVIYWSDWKQTNIPNIAQNGGSLNDPLALAVGGHGRLYGIAAVRKQCPRARNSCGLGNGGCPFLCLASPNGGRTCACPDGADPRICKP